MYSGQLGKVYFWTVLTSLIYFYIFSLNYSTLQFTFTLTKLSSFAFAYETFLLVSTIIRVKIMTYNVVSC